ncbi:hypothetical protein COO60DRAFT_1472521 [Scenedesmus sp. NREL 46B-D3]|nr:hypothetical protein COO60DRAFT_1472521 [Scenedesmus sp. NREL 46B-D3]
MRRKIRCQFEVHSSEITGIPQEYDQVKLVIGHQQSNKRYAASYAIPTSGSDQRERSTKGIEGATAWEPLLAFTCHVYPSKAVDVRLMASSSGSGSRPLLARGPQWTTIACTTLHLDSLAHHLLLPGIPSSGAANATSAPTPPAPAAAAAPAAPEPASKQQPASPSRPSLELFTTDSLAAAVTARHSRRLAGDAAPPPGMSSPLASPSLGTPTASSARAGLGSMSDLLAAADTAAVPDTAEVPPEAEDSQTTRVQVQWAAAGGGGGTNLQQEARRSRGCCWSDGALGLADVAATLLHSMYAQRMQCCQCVPHTACTHDVCSAVVLSSLRHARQAVSAGERERPGLPSHIRHGVHAARQIAAERKKCHVAERQQQQQHAVAY